MYYWYCISWLTYTALLLLQNIIPVDDTTHYDTSTVRMRSEWYEQP